MDSRRAHRSTRDVIAEAVDTSLARLKIERIDLYQIHWPQRNVPMFGATEFEPSKERAGPPIEEQVDALAALIKAGKIRHYGLSNETAWGVCEFQRAAKALGVPGPVTIQNSYSLLSRGVDNDLAETLFRENMSLLAYSPLGGGMLSGKYLGGAKPPNARYSLFDGLGLRFRKPIVHEAAEAYAALARRLRHLAGATRARLREEPVASRRDDPRRHVHRAARRGHCRSANGLGRGDAGGDCRSASAVRESGRLTFRPRHCCPSAPNVRTSCSTHPQPWLDLFRAGAIHAVN